MRKLRDNLQKQMKSVSMAISYTEKKAEAMT